MTSNRLQSDTLITARPVIDALDGDDGAVLLLAHGTGHRVVRLSLLGALVREQAEPGISLGELATVMSVLLGPPPTGDPIELVAAVVSELQAEGIVSVGRDASTSSESGSSSPDGGEPGPVA